MTDYSRWYRAGTVKVTKDSANISGTSTFWNVGNPIRPGDLFTIDGAAFYEIADVTGADTLVLASPFKGASVASTTYAVIRNFSVQPGAELVAAQIQLISKSLLRERQLTDWATKPASADPVNPTKVTITSFDGVAMDIYSLPQIIDSGVKLADELSGSIAQTRDNLAKSNASRDAAKTSETNAAASSAAARTSEQNAKISETNSKTSETNAAASKTAAGTSETNAAASKTAAATSATNASSSEGKAKTSETNAKTSETNAKTSETNAKTSETNAAGSATAATASKTAAGTSETNAKASENAAAASKTAAATSETNAKTSETNAKASENAAAASKTAASTSETNASNSATSAANSASGATAGAMFAMPREFSQKGKFFTLTNTVGPAAADIPDANFVAEAGFGTVFKSAATSPVYPRPKGYLRNAPGRTYRATAVARSIAGASTLGLSILTVNDALATSVMANIAANVNLPKDGAWQTVSFSFTSNSTAPYVTCQAIATAGSGATVELQALYIEDITDSQAASDSAAASGDSQAKAKTSETNAKTSETNAATSETNAAASKTAAAGSATAAATSATNAKTSETNAKTSETNAKASETSAAASSSAAGGAKTAAETARDLAQQWADAPRNTEVQPGKFSARHWAETMQAASTGTLVYMGSWDASKSTLPASPKKGDFYIISVAGTVSSVKYNVGDMIVCNDKGGWDRIDNQQTVTSVAGRTGAVTLGIGDISSLQANLDTLTYAVKSALSAGEDYIPNPTFESRYDRMGFTVVATTDPDVPPGCPHPYAAKLAVRDHTPNFDPFQVQPGDVIEMSALVASSVGTPGTNPFNFYVRQSAYSPWAPGGAGTYTYTNVKSQAISAGWVKVVGRYTVPANGSVRWILPFLQINQNSPDYGSIWYATDWHVRNLTAIAAVESSKLDSAAFTWANLANKPATFTPSAHTHAISEVTNLQRNLDMLQWTGGGNMVADGNFERKLWDLTQSGAGGRCSYVSDSRSGSVAVQIGPGTGDVSLGMPIQTIPVVAGRTYRMSCYYKTTADYNGAVNNSKLRLGDSGGGLLLAPVFSGNKTSWTLVTVDYKVPIGVTGFQLSVNANQTVGTLTVDDVSIIDITDDLDLITQIGTKLDSSAFMFAGLGGKPTSLAGYGITDAVSSATTGLGRTGAVPMDSTTNTAAAWSALPVGYARLMNSTIGTAGGLPEANTGYFFKVANRDTGGGGGGWSGLFVGRTTGNSFVGYAEAGTDLPTWAKIWTDKNFDPTTKASLSGATFTGTILSKGATVIAGQGAGAALAFRDATGVTNRHALVAQDGSLDVIVYDDAGAYKASRINIPRDTGSVVKIDGQQVWTAGSFTPANKVNFDGSTTITGEQTFSGLAPLRLTGTGASGFLYVHGLNGGGDDIFNIQRVGVSNYVFNVMGVLTASADIKVGASSVWHAGNFNPATKADWTGGSFSGDVTMNGRLYANAGIRVVNSNTAFNGQGSYIGWNRNYRSGNGEMDFINHKGGGTGGWAFFNTDGTTYWEVASINANGAIFSNSDIVANSNFTANGGYFSGAGPHAVMGPQNAGGTCYLRPNGPFNGSGEFRVSGDGGVWISGDIQLSGGNGMLYGANNGFSVRVGNGSVGYRYYTFNGNNGDLICANGWMYANNFKMNSDARLKSEREVLDGRVELERLNMLVGEVYTKGGFREHGFIAQDFRKVYPSMVSEGEGLAGKDTLSISYSELIAPMVAAIKELNRRMKLAGI